MSIDRIFFRPDNTMIIRMRAANNTYKIVYARIGGKVIATFPDPQDNGTTMLVGYRP